MNRVQCGILWGCLLFFSAEMQAQPRAAIDDWAEAFVELTAPKWGGQRVEPLTYDSRPEDSVWIWQSDVLPISFHTTTDLPIEDVAPILKMIEHGFESLITEGWQFDFLDGGKGETQGFDFYISDAPEVYEVRADSEVHFSYLDRVTNFVLINPAILDHTFAAEWVLFACLDALLQRLDPAESNTWRKMTAAWLVVRVFGDFPEQYLCAKKNDNTKMATCFNTHKSWFERGDSVSKGLFLMDFVSNRHDGGSGEFWRDLWQLARQRTWEGDAFRGSPDLWEALRAASEKAGDPFESLMRELAVSFWFSHATWKQGQLFPEVALDFRVDANDLPFHSGSIQPPLEAYGSAYGIVDVDQKNTTRDLRIWVRGEYGVRWSLTAIALDASGKEIRRVQAYPRKLPELYVPLSLNDGAEFVLVVVTNLSNRIPDEDIPDENVRTFSLIIDN